MTAESRFRIGISDSAALVIEPGKDPVPIPCAAAVRRFADASFLDFRGRARPEAWVVGDDAAALQRELVDIGDLEFYDALSATEQDSVQRWRMQVGLLATIRDRIASELEIRSNIETVFCLQYPKSEWSLDVRTERPRTNPPFWLVYGLRRLKWPGRLGIVFAVDPLREAAGIAAQKPADTAEAVRPFSVEPCLQHMPGTLIDAVPPRRSAPLRVDVQTDGGPLIIVAPEAAALPVQVHLPVADGTAGDGKISFVLIRDADRTNNQKLLVTRAQPDPNGQLVGWIPAPTAPLRRGPPYQLTADIDVWGRFRISMTDPLGPPLPITYPTLETGDNKPTSREAYTLHVSSLLFPERGDIRLLGAVPVLGYGEGDDEAMLDPVDVLDSTSFNGGPALPLKANAVRERHALERQEFWEDELDYIRAVLKPRTVRLLELAICAIRAPYDPEDPRTRPYDYKTPSKTEMETLVRQRKLVDFDRVPGPDQVGFAISGDQRIEPVLRALHDFVPDELSTMKSEIAEVMERMRQVARASARMPLEADK